MKGKELSIDQVRNLEHGTFVYVKRRGDVKLERIIIDNGVFSLSDTAYEDDLMELSEDNKYYEFVKSTDVGEIPTMSFDSIHYAVATCKYKNDKARKVHGTELFPGIDEALNILNDIATKRGIDNAN